MCRGCVLCMFVCICECLHRFVGGILCVCLYLFFNCDCLDVSVFLLLS